MVGFAVLIQNIPVQPQVNTDYCFVSLCFYFQKEIFRRVVCESHYCVKDHCDLRKKLGESSFHDRYACEMLLQVAAVSFLSIWCWKPPYDYIIYLKTLNDQESESVQKSPSSLCLDMRNVCTTLGVSTLFLKPAPQVPGSDPVQGY